MRRPFAWMGAGFAFGIFLARKWSVPPELSFTVLTLVLPLFYFARSPKTFVPAILGGFFLLGCLRDGVDRLIPPDHISNFYFPRAASHAFEGRVISDPEIKHHGRKKTISFRFKIESMLAESARQPVSGTLQVFLFSPGWVPDYGDRLRIYGKVMIPKTRPFRGGFDYGKYLASQKVSRVFNGFGRRSAKLMEPARPSFLGTVLAGRRLIHRRLERFLPFPENQLMAALLIGSREKLPGEIRDTFARTGTAHILAVSGLNVSIVGGMLFFLLKAARLPRKISALVAMVAVTFYVLISGANPPVLRAGIMGGILMFGLMSERKSELLNTLAFAFFALLFVNPRNLFAVDFQLSFLCVSAIFFALPAHRQPAAGLRAVFVFYRDILASTLAATVGTLPLTLHYFHLFSPVSVPANLALVPLMNFATVAGFLILPGMLAGDVPPFLGVVPGLALRLSLALNQNLARLPYASFVLPPPPVLMIWVYYGAVLALWLLVRRGKGRISLWSLGMMGVSLVVLAVFAQSVRRDLSLRIHVLKAKEGSMAVLEMPARRRHLIIQPGDKKWGREWRWTVKPFLEELGTGSAEAIVFGSLDAHSTAEIRDAVRACRPRRVFLAAPEKGRSYKRERILEGFSPALRPQAVFLGTDQEFLKLSGVSFRWRRDQNVSMLELTYANRKILLLLRGEVSSRGSHPVIDLQAVPHAMTLRFHPWNPAAFVES